MPTRITACGSLRASTRMNLWLNAEQLDRLQAALSTATGLEASRTVIVRRALDLLDQHLADQAQGYAERAALEEAKR